MFFLVVPCNGGEFNGTAGIIESANYPNDYPMEQNCIYKIRVQKEYVVQLTFETFETERYFDFVKVCIIIYDYVCV